MDSWCIRNTRLPSSELIVNLLPSRSWKVARKTLASFGVAVYNGAAEKTVHLVRQLANCFMQELEKNGSADRPVFNSLHPMTAWSLVHAAWVRNHFVVQEG